MLAAEQLHAVTVATQASEHLRLARLAVRAGVRVLVEKPIVASADDLAQLAELDPGLVVPGHLLRFCHAYRWLEEIVSTGRIGDLTGIVAQRSRDRTHLEYGEPDPLLLTQIHDCDLALWLDPSMPREVMTIGHSSSSVQFDDVYTHVLTGSGTRWSLRADFGLPAGTGPCDLLTVYGTHGTASVEVGRQQGIGRWLGRDGQAQRRWHAPHEQALEAELASFVDAPAPSGDDTAGDGTAGDDTAKDAGATLAEAITVTRTMLAARSSLSAAETIDVAVDPAEAGGSDSVQWPTVPS